ncbi:MAG: hypothetical protein Q8L45_06180 [Xanthomonadaceae bacterium]|nr:hypothetical protein [Xanthomonadaceae bacterium]MDP2186810.1 hypothetical protein [Xanthomonadales bacterium]MDZ4117529.1 hypothetical protein [Xanthomonadaceae bacterium]MDZ4377774.1 hypothetical protein [Xanthomonadaceae bacterium]
MASNPWGERAAQVATFRRALQALRERLRATLAGGTGDADTCEGLSSEELRQRHLLLWSSASQHLVDALQALNRDVWEADAPDAAAIYRAAGRVEGVIERWLRGFIEVRDVYPGAETASVRAQLLALYQHSLDELSDWLEQMDDTLEHPLARIAPDRLAGTDPVHIELECHLTLTAPAELIQPLLPPPRPDHRNGLLSLAAAFGIGWMLGDDD